MPRDWITRSNKKLPLFLMIQQHSWVLRPFFLLLEANFAELEWEIFLENRQILLLWLELVLFNFAWLLVKLLLLNPNANCDHTEIASLAEKNVHCFFREGTLGGEMLAGWQHLWVSSIFHHLRSNGLMQSLLSVDATITGTDPHRFPPFYGNRVRFSWPMYF